MLAFLLPIANQTLVGEGLCLLGFNLCDVFLHAGRNKALWLIEYGFTPETLGEALRHHAAAHDVARIEESPFGKRFVIEGTLVTLDGRNPPVRSIWFIETGDDVPRLVTLYPLRRSDT